MTQPGSIELDLTVDDLNPLGVTQVAYEPDMQRMREVMAVATLEYNNLSVSFDTVMNEYIEDLKQA